MWWILAGCAPEPAFDYVTSFWQTDVAFTQCQLSYDPVGAGGSVGDTGSLATSEPVASTGAGQFYPPPPYFGVICNGASCICFRDAGPIGTFQDEEFCAYVDKWQLADLPSSEARITKRVAENCPF
jgi:hypothetical protein